MPKKFLTPEARAMLEWRDRRNVVTRRRLKRWLREVRDFDPAITMKDLIDYLRVRREWAAKLHLVSNRPK